MPRNVLGIDFGTTFSSVAIMPIGSQNPPRLFEFEGSRHHMPTVLLTDVNDDSLIAWGWAAKRDMHTHSHSTVQAYFKRNSTESDEALRFCKIYLSQLYKEVCLQKNLNELGSDFVTVIGTPANWDEEQSKRIKESAESVGFPEVRILPEPVAAMHSLRCQEEGRIKFSDKPEYFMVVDFGGGTLDICIVQTGELGRNPKILATDGDPLLGGVNFDEMLEKRFLRSQDIKLGELSNFEKIELRDQVTNAKESFSDQFQKKTDPATYLVKLLKASHSFSITKHDFEKLCEDQGIISKIESALKRSLEKANKSPSDISRVVLTGGSSKWYFLKEIVSKLTALFGDKLSYTESPYTDVALGLAISVGRSDEPSARPGVWVDVDVNHSHLTRNCAVLDPGRIYPYTKDNRKQVFLGTIKKSRLLSKYTISICWLHGASENSLAKYNSSKISIYARSNHPRIEFLKALSDLKNDGSAKLRSDEYSLYISAYEDEFGSHYSVIIKNNRGISTEVEIVPGSNVKQTWLGMGRFKAILDKSEISSVDKENSKNSSDKITQATSESDTRTKPARSSFPNILRKAFFRKKS